MGNPYLLDIGVLQAIGWWTIFRYLLFLVVAIAACVYFTRRRSKSNQQTLRQRTVIVVLGLALTNLFLLDLPDVFYAGWMVLTLAITGVFANTKLGLAISDYSRDSRIKLDPYLRNGIFWIVLFILILTISFGSDIIVKIARGPQIVPKIMEINKTENPSMLSVTFREYDHEYNYISATIPSRYLSGIGHKACVEVTYYEPLLASPPFRLVKVHITQIRLSDECSGGE